jgi:hypothetical protein
MNNIIKIQSIYRNNITRKKSIISSSYYQTKNWRQNQIWYKNGKFNECEKYQINIIEQIIKTKLNKTNERINIETVNIVNIKNPNTNIDGYEYTENFDGKIINNNTTYYFNLKFVCNSGGSQTRTLREVYHFIKYQLEYLIKSNKSNINFINILDGDTSYYNISKFNYLINKEKYSLVLQYIFVGSLFDFKNNKILINKIKT